MTPGNENARNPELENEDTHSVAAGPVESGRIAEDLAPEDGPYTDEPGEQRVNVTELGPLFGGSQASEFQQRWQYIQSGFVDDPASAVRRAEDLIDTILASLSHVLEERRQILDQSARNGDTEQLRLVLRQYGEVLEGVTSV